jgi:hypothetical protein
MFLSEPEMSFYWGPDALKVRKMKRVLISSITTCALYLKLEPFTVPCKTKESALFLWLIIKQKKKSLMWTTLRPSVRPSVTYHPRRNSLLDFHENWYMTPL